MVAGSILILNYFYVNTNGYKARVGIQKFEDVGHDLEIINFGSSHGMRSLDYGKLESRTFNFALPSQSLYYDYQLLNRYAGHLSDNCVVLIVLSYFSFGSNKVVVDSDNSRYYSLLSKKSIYDYSFSNYFKYKLFPIFTAKESLFCIFNDKKSADDHIKMISSNMYQENELDDVGKKRADFIGRTVDAGNYKGNSEYLVKMIGLCRERKLIPIMVVTPYTRYFNSHVSKKPYYKEFYRIADQVSKKYGVPFLDYSRDELFEDRTDLFMDADHLNLKGRVMFTEILLKDIEKIDKETLR
ncbi:hypothetical protein ACFLQ8_01750 [Candidatus Auribacterota bacterium]